MVSWDFALGIVPGWHSTIFAPYFVAGAIHSGLAMVLTLMIPMRKMFRYEAFITKDILDNIAKTIVFTGLIVGYAYMRRVLPGLVQPQHRGAGVFPVAGASGTTVLEFWIMVICNSVVPLLFFIRKVRRSIPWLFGISILINIGMWYERFVIIIGGVAHDFMPNAWGTYSPTIIEYGILVGSFSLFFFPFPAFCKTPPLGVHDGDEGKRAQRRGPCRSEKQVLGLFKDENLAAAAIEVHVRIPWQLGREQPFSQRKNHEGPESREKQGGLLHACRRHHRFSFRG